MGKQQEAEIVHSQDTQHAVLTWQEAAYPRSIDYDSASVLQKAFFTYASPFLERGKKSGLQVLDAGPLLSTTDRLSSLVATYSKQFANESKLASARGSKRNALLHSLLRSHKALMIQQSGWVVLESLFRLLSPVGLRQLIRWLRAYEDPDQSPQERYGWMWAGLLIAFQLGLALTHHQLFWCGMRLGFLLKQQAIAAVQEKLLRLNSATFNHVSTGHIVNLVSNDVRRFDEFGPFWVFGWAGPLEALAVLVMIAMEMGWWPAIAGVSTLLLVIPVQVKLAGRIANLRTRSAGRTDERVRITGEVVEGAANVKMLCWEEPFRKLLGRIRRAETGPMRTMLLIDASCMALMFFCVPVACVVTFGTAVAMKTEANEYVLRRYGRSICSVWGFLPILLCSHTFLALFFGSTTGERWMQFLKLESVFYVVALLNLPKLWLALFFVKAIKSTSEMFVATKRIFGFIQELEARAPAEEDAHDIPEGSVEFRGADFSWGSRAWAGQTDILPGDTDSGAPAATSEDPKAISSNPEKALPAAAKTWDMEACGGGRNQEEQNAASGVNSLNAASAIYGAAAAASKKDYTAPLTLYSPEFTIAPGEFVGVAGEVGSGKSSLLAALLGELQPVPQPGHVAGNDIERAPRMRGRVAYCQQVPWIEAGSVRDNIIFGAEFEPDWYATVRTACALDYDISLLPAGDDTEIGERGVNLSGGQKARLALARAAYARPAIALLDDPLSAVDPKVAKILFQDCIGPEGLLRNTTRILVTHQTQWLHSCSRVIVLQAGTILADAPWKRLQHSDNLPQGLSNLTAPDQRVQDAQSNPGVHILVPSSHPPPHMTQHNPNHSQKSLHLERDPDLNGAGDNGSPPGHPTADEAAAHSSPMGATLAEPGQEDEAAVDADTVGAVGSVSIPTDSRQKWDSSARVAVGAVDTKDVEVKAGYENDTEKEGKAESLPGSSVVELAATSKAAVSSPKRPSDGTSSDDTQAGQLTQVEHREKGALKGNVFLQYAVAMGSFKVTVILLALLLGQATWIMSEWWLARWSQVSAIEQRDDMWLWVYGTLVASVVVLSLFRNLAWFVTALSAGSRLNARMLECVLRARLSFFHTTPTGRILNVFSKDQGSVDEQLPQVSFDALQTMSVTTGAIILISVANPPIIPIFLPLGYLFFQIRQYYLASSREVKRLEAVTRSPVYAMFSASIKGLPTIRAFGATKRFRQTFLDALDVNGSWWIAYISCARWVGARMDAIALVLLAVSVIVAMAAKTLMSASLLALALTHLLQLSGSMQWAVRQTAEAENHMTSVERVLAYTQLPQERPATVAAGGGAPPKGWPSSAKLEFDRVEARYRPGLPPVLKDLSFTIPSGATCGVVGRTGSGKSSLLLALFDLIEITGGRVLLDGLDVSKVALDNVRQQIAIIPQDPLLFSGSLRTNLDPWDAKSDDAVWAALRSVQLEAAVTALGGLRTTMAEAGGNFSAGQRQLLCLARALLTEARVLALDEATANVDRVTDGIIQSTLQRAVKGDDVTMERIMLVIAHRVDTIYDCDQLLVLADGRLVQSGRPRDLAEGSGTFAQLVRAAHSNEHSDAVNPLLDASASSSLNRLYYKQAS